MKLTYKIALGLAVVAGAGIVVYLSRCSNNRRMLSKIADEGYETAQDILFPDKNFQYKHLRYGPVIPGEYI